MLHIGIHDIYFLHPALRLQIAGFQLCGTLMICHLIGGNYLFQTIAAGNGIGSLPHKLHAIVFLGIVAGSNHNAAIGFQMHRTKINHLRTALPYIQSITASLSQTAHQGSLQ